MEKDIVLTEFGKRVREERLKRRLTQEEFSGIAGVHRTYIGMVERGEINLTLINLLKISKALNKEPSRLLGQL